MHFPIRQIDLREFPPLLREIADPPKHLRIRGDLPRDTLFLTVVGSRKYTPYGKASCERLIEGLRGYPVTIVSGLALGIDTIAHEAALRAGLTTVAVMPSGLSDSVLYPPSHRAVAERILIKGGALLSEFADDFTPQPWSFPQRNRIEAGMAKATLIIEAAERSGTLITARLAMEYNREVLVVPHPIGGESGAGGNRLLREGTTLIRSSDDILEALGMSVEVKEVHTPADLSPDERVVFESPGEPLERDALVGKAGLPVTRTNIALSSLLIKGFLAERMGKIERI